MLFLVAVIAQGLAVRDHQAQLRVSREGLHVVSSKVPAAIVSAPDAFESVAGEDVEPPPFVFGAESLAPALRESSVAVGMASVPARGSFPDDRRDLAASLDRVRSPSKRTRLSLLRGAHLRACLGRHRAAFHRRWSVDARRLLRSRALAALRSAAVESASIRNKIVPSGLPYFARATAFQACKRAASIFTHRKPALFRRAL